MPIPAVGTPPLSQVVTDVVDGLQALLPPLVAGLPAPNVTVESVRERPIGLGNRRGHEMRQALPPVALKGGRVELSLRCQLWENSPAAVDAAILQLQNDVLDARQGLRALGFLRLTATETSAAEHVAAIPAWRKTASFGVLYEYRYEDADGAHSLIARIPIHSDPEQRDSPNRETTIVVDEMLRWDDERAPQLVVRGPSLPVRRIVAVYFVSGAQPTGRVTMVRTFEGAVGPPTSFGLLSAFLDATGGSEPVERHASIEFVSPAAFVAALGPQLNTIELGDWNTDTVPDVYGLRARPIEPAILLPDPTDRLTLSHQHAAFDRIAVLYVRLSELG